MPGSGSDGDGFPDTLYGLPIGDDLPGGIMPTIFRALGNDLRSRPGPIVAVVTILICLPFIRSVWWMSDEGILLQAARRMAGGETLYGDFFELHPPLAFLLVRAWQAIFGETLVAIRLGMVLVLSGIAWLAYACSFRLSGNVPLSAFLALAWVIASQGLWTQLNHSWISTLFSMLAFRASLGPARNEVRPFLTGMAAGAAAVVTTSRGGLTVIAACLSLLNWRSPRMLLRFVAGGALVAAAMLVYLLATGSVTMAYQQVVVFAATHYSNIQYVPFGSFVTRQSWPLVAAFPLAAVAVIVLLIRRRTDLFVDPDARTAIIFAIIGFIGCFPRPDAAHIGFCVPFVLPLLARIFDRITPRGRLGQWLFAAVMLAMLPPLVAITKEAIRVMRQPLHATRAGTISFITPAGEPALLARLATLPIGQEVLFYPYSPLLAVLSARHHPARVDVFVPNYSTPEQYQEACWQMMDRADWVVVDGTLTGSDPFRKVFPAMTNPSPPERTAFEAAVQAGFVLDARYGHYDLLRRSRPSRLLCTGIDAPPVSP